MWKRKPGRPRDEARTDPRSSLPGLGVGVQVYVREQAPPAAADWVGEPTGVIVAPGDRSVRNVYGPVDGLTTWLVAFSEPQWRRDGRGPYENAIIPSGLLVPAEPAE
ncbi:iron-dependent peroxidase [Leifsonia xyli subsp. cynodontis DSM 46306]|jgi:hypothetical protein|uniref:Uncharacterized protein n=1 Tax=Leifsonia xyli subsp. cynodontis DSM 46306 TaxID=1389489 RepID=U3PCC4_LEIXC|nr:hypothetical protein [Leifsonia xyli]AGW41178.1 iron-dependent peroxidase [Leifsonia xyli subsp. cynodontis DSM 46306]